MKGTINYALTYSNATEIEGHSDADWAGDPDDRRSTTGYVFTLNGAAVTWNSKRQQTIALSSTEAEYMALAHTAKESAWIKGILCELGFHSRDTPITIHCDNQSSMNIAKNPIFHSRTKHIDVRHHFIRERLSMNEIEITYRPTKDMLADVLTKGLGKEKHYRFVEGMGLLDSK